MGEDWLVVAQRKRERKTKSKQLNMRVSKVDEENIELMIKRINKDRRWGKLSKSNAVVQCVLRYLTEHKIKHVVE